MPQGLDFSQVAGCGAGGVVTEVNMRQMQMQQSAEAGAGILVCVDKGKACPARPLSDTIIVDV